jgi:hypothetical protein
MKSYGFFGALMHGFSVWHLASSGSEPQADMGRERLLLSPSNEDAP